MSDEKFRVARHTGRLLESRLFALWSDADAEKYARTFWTLARTLGGSELPVLIADHRPVRAYPANVLSRLDELFASLNVKLERVSILTDKNNASVTLQLQRVVDRAGFNNRRLFTDPAAGLEHLKATLTPAELERAKTFIAEWPPAS